MSDQPGIILLSSPTGVLMLSYVTECAGSLPVGHCVNLSFKFKLGMLFFF